MEQLPCNEFLAMGNNNKTEQQDIRSAAQKTAMENAFRELVEARRVLNDARKMANEKKKIYLALGGTLAKKNLGPRNRRIYKQHIKGRAVEELAELFRLSKERIKWIVGQEQRMELKRKR